MPARPSVAAVIPVYNGQTQVGAAISSALSQTRPPAEIIVVDDGSTDSSADIARAYPAPVRLLQQSNGGVAHARNTAVHAARSDLIALLDADDQWLPAHLERGVDRWLAETGRTGDQRVIVTGNAFRVGARGLTDSTILTSGFPSADRQRQRILENNFTGIFAIYPRHLHEEVGDYDSTLRQGEDRDLWTRALLSGWRIVPQMEPQALYWLGGASLSTDHEKMNAAERKILAKARDELGDRLTPGERDYLDMRLAGPSPRLLIRDANDSIRSAAWSDAAAQLEQAARMLPSDDRLQWRARLARRRWARPLLTMHLKASDRKLERTSS